MNEKERDYNNDLEKGEFGLADSGGPSHQEELAPQLFVDLKLTIPPDAHLNCGPSLEGGDTLLTSGIPTVQQAALCRLSGYHHSQTPSKTSIGIEVIDKRPASKWSPPGSDGSKRASWVIE